MCLICPIKLLIATQRTVNVMASGAEWQRFYTSPLPRDSASTNATNGSPSLRETRRHFGNCRRRGWGHRGDEAQAQKKKLESDSPAREKPTVESVEAARAKLVATAVRIQRKCLMAKKKKDESDDIAARVSSIWLEEPIIEDSTS